jgi:predicted 3-demethylubiquinone-9 3-methyltransferase (glyoxalase superfamily)
MQKIIPHLWYDKEAKEAALLYVTLFDNSKLLGTDIIEDTPSGDAEIVHFELAGQPFEAINAGPYFKFWDKLSAVPEAEQCGWVKDRFGVSWQIVPENMDDIFANGTKDEIKRVTEAFLKMKKLDLATLEKARLGI